MNKAKKWIKKTDTMVWDSDWEQLENLEDECLSIEGEKHYFSDGSYIETAHLEGTDMILFIPTQPITDTYYPGW